MRRRIFVRVDFETEFSVGLLDVRFRTILRQSQNPIMRSPSSFFRSKYFRYNLNLVIGISPSIGPGVFTASIVATARTRTSTSRC